MIGVVSVILCSIVSEASLASEIDLILALAEDTGSCFIALSVATDSEVGPVLGSPVEGGCSICTTISIGSDGPVVAS